jgi:hypothetical protein
MRYRDQALRDTEFTSPSPLFEWTAISNVLGEIHHLEEKLFSKLYLQRVYKIASPEVVRALADVTRVNIGTWRETIDEEGSGQTEQLPELSPDQKELVEREELRRAKVWGSPQTVIEVVAPVGFGKTTFLRYLLGIYLPKVYRTFLKRRLLSVIFDFRIEEVPTTTEHDSIQVATRSLCKYLEAQLDRSFIEFGHQTDTDAVGGYYKHELEIYADVLRHDYNVESDRLGKLGTELFNRQRSAIAQYKSEHVVDALNLKLVFIKKRHKDHEFVFAIDNVDQYFRFQPAIATAVGNRIVGKLKIPTIVAVRDTTHRRLGADGILDQWQNPTTIVLTTLAARQLGERRFKGIIDAMAAEELAATKTSAPETNLERLQIKTFLQRILGQLSRTYSQERSKSFELPVIWSWLESMSNNNVREMLNLLKTVLASRHLTSPDFERKTAKYLAFEPDMPINVKRFKTAFINGCQPYFSEVESGTYVVNLFDFDRRTPMEEIDYPHIFALRILQLIKKKGTFWLGVFIKDLTSALDPSVQTGCERVLQRFVEKGIIAVERDLGPGMRRFEWGHQFDIREEAESNSRATITKNGDFHLSHLIYDDIYLDEMKFSADFGANEFKQIFEGRTQERNPVGRINASVAFAKLLTHEEERTESINDALEIPTICREIWRRYVEGKEIEGFRLEPQALPH